MARRLSNEKSLEVPRTNSWSMGLFSTCLQVPGEWCYSCWCPCLVYKEILEVRHVQAANALAASQGSFEDEEERKELADKAKSGSHPWLSCCWWTTLTCCCCAGPFFSACDRSDIRKDYLIDGSYCGDLFVHCCCLPCGLVQEKHQVSCPVANGKRVDRMDGIMHKSSEENVALKGSSPPPEYLETEA
eukprot:TRINITY_DN78858_c0_g1_i1.p1 TRINITY_DN78858_c0_g1~~TRINITY_DN78858_c0_g1_i1.p1  ORF type:complete len:188 (-),score=23.32 TRINITY_DN78858_c0_g1_i1:70-633(-)